MGRSHNLQFGPFWGPIYHWKTENTAKNQKPAKTTSSGISNNIIQKSKKTHIVLVKLIKNKFLDPKWA